MRSLSSEGGNPSSPTKNTDCPFGRSVFFFAWKAVFFGAYGDAARIQLTPHPSQLTAAPLHSGAQPAPAATGRPRACQSNRRTPSARRACTATDTPLPTTAAAQSKPHIAASAFPLSIGKIIMRLNNCRPEFKRDRILCQEVFCNCIKIMRCRFLQLAQSVVFLTKTKRFKARFLTFCTKKMRKYMENGYCNPSPFALP